MDQARLQTYNKDSLRRMALNKGLTNHGFNGRSLSRMRKQDFIDFMVNHIDDESDEIVEEGNLMMTLFRDLILEDTFQPIMNLMGALGGLDPAIRLIGRLEVERSNTVDTTPQEERVPNEEDEITPNLLLQDLDGTHSYDCICEICQKNKTAIRKNLKVKESIHNIETKVTCVVCLTHMRNVVFSPCNHLATCITCSKNPSLDKCPLCRKKFERTTRIFC